jgi:hypothetical protein
VSALERVCVKVYAPEPGVPDSAFVPVFHDWIRRRVIGGVLLDVGDYTHVPEGPGVVLVGHEFTYSLDRSYGRFGLLVQRRSSTGVDAEEAVAATLQTLLAAAEKLETDRSLRGAITFDRSVLRIESNDRLRAASDGDGAGVLRVASEAAVRRILPNAVMRLQVVADDPRNRLAVTVAIEALTRSASASLQHMEREL